MSILPLAITLTSTPLAHQVPVVGGQDLKPLPSAFTAPATWLQTPVTFGCAIDWKMLPASAAPRSMLAATEGPMIVTADEAPARNEHPRTTSATGQSIKSPAPF